MKAPLRTTQTPAGNCPKCRGELSACTSVDGDETPSEGHPTVCWYCGEILVLDADLIPRKPTLNELMALQSSQEWPKLERIARAVKLRVADEKVKP